MPLTFAEAKLQYNPDPTWEPKRDSPEYYDIIKLMKQSGHIFQNEVNNVQREIPFRDLLKDGIVSQHLNRSVKRVFETSTSKKDFISVASNKIQIDTHLIQNKPLLMQTVVVDIPIKISHTTMESLKTKGLMHTINAIKGTTKGTTEGTSGSGSGSGNGKILRMSKEEFQNMEENREYIKQHILILKN